MEDKERATEAKGKGTIVEGTGRDGRPEKGRTGRNESQNREVERIMGLSVMAVLFLCNLIRIPVKMPNEKLKCLYELIWSLQGYFENTYFYKYKIFYYII